MLLAASMDEARSQAVRDAMEFLSIASHELKTPLTALKLQAQLMRRLCHDQDLIAMIEESEQQIDRVTLLVDTLLDVTRISCGQFSLDLEHLTLDRLIRDVARRLRLELELSGCSLELNLADSVSGVWDRMRLEQVMTNIISNAMKYAPGKPIKVSLEVQKTKVVLKVQDHGNGIPKDSFDRIFRRFERVSPGQRTCGLGLGLYIVRQILAAMNGSISVQSELGQGSTFTVELPLSR